MQSSTMGSERPESSWSTSFATPGSTSVTVPSSRASLFLHLQPDQLEDVVLVVAGRLELRARNFEQRTAGNPAIEPDDRASSGLPARHDLRRLARDDQLGADLEARRRLTRVLDDERAVEPVRLADPADRDRVRRVHCD